MGLRVRLFLLVLIAVLPAIAIQIYTEIDLRRAREAEIHEDALRHAGTVASACWKFSRAAGSSWWRWPACRPSRR